jgi:hypothetical protein
MQLLDRGGQLVSRPTPNPTVSPGWANNDLTQATAPTIMDPDFLNATIAELTAFLSYVGLTASKTSAAQVLQAVLRIAGGNTLSVTAAGTTTLTADNAGLVLVDATAGNITLDLPAAIAAGAAPINFTFVRFDNTANTVTVTPTLPDIWVLGVAPVTIGGLNVLRIISNATNAWILLTPQPVTPTVITAAGAYSATIPGGMTRAELTIVGGGGGGAGTNGIYNAGGGGAGGTGIKWLTGLVAGQAITGTVGAAGTAGTAGASGGNGGNTTAQVNGAGTVYTADGGVGGVFGLNPSGGAGGTVSGCDLGLTGGWGDDGSPPSVTYPAGRGAPGYLGMGGGRGGAGAGIVATAPGAGGGGSYATSSSGGAGAPGLVLIKWSP